MLVALHLLLCVARLSESSREEIVVFLLLVISDLVRATIACIVRMQSLAMVLLDPDPVQLSGDGHYSCRCLSLALARAGVTTT